MDFTDDGFLEQIYNIPDDLQLDEVFPYKQTTPDVSDSSDSDMEEIADIDNSISDPSIALSFYPKFVSCKQLVLACAAIVLIVIEKGMTCVALDALLAILHVSKLSF